MLLLLLYTQIRTLLYSQFVNIIFPTRLKHLNKATCILILDAGVNDRPLSSLPSQASHILTHMVGLSRDAASIDTDICLSKGLSLIRRVAKILK